MILSGLGMQILATTVLFPGYFMTCCLTLYDLVYSFVLLYAVLVSAGFSLKVYFKSQSYHSS